MDITDILNKKGINPDIIPKGPEHPEIIMIGVMAPDAAVNRMYAQVFHKMPDVILIIDDTMQFDDMPQFRAQFIEDMITAAGETIKVSIDRGMKSREYSRRAYEKTQSRRYMHNINRQAVYRNKNCI
jgi:hypothetical protein